MRKSPLFTISATIGAVAASGGGVTWLISRDPAQGVLVLVVLLAAGAYTRDQLARETRAEREAVRVEARVDQLETELAAERRARADDLAAERRARAEDLAAERIAHGIAMAAMRRKMAERETWFAQEGRLFVNRLAHVFTFLTEDQRARLPGFEELCNGFMRYATTPRPPPGDEPDG